MRLGPILWSLKCRVIEDLPKPLFSLGFRVGVGDNVLPGGRALRIGAASLSFRLGSKGPQHDGKEQCTFGPRHAQDNKQKLQSYLVTAAGVTRYDCCRKFPVFPPNPEGSPGTHPAGVHMTARQKPANAPHWRSRKAVSNYPENSRFGWNRIF